MAFPRFQRFMGITTDLAHHFLEAVDQAAIASAAWRGKGDKNAADDAAVEAMRRTFDAVPFDGRVAIGEGERDEAPMLYIGEELGSMVGHAGAPQIDIAVDPLECTNNCADNQPNSIAVLAAAPRGTLLHAPTSRTLQGNSSDGRAASSSRRWGCFWRHLGCERRRAL